MVEEKAASLLFDHYKDSFRYLMIHFKARNRILVWILIVLAILAIDILSPGKVGLAANLLLEKTVAPEHAGPPAELSIDFALVGTAVWVALLFLVVQYYQRSIHVDRQFNYVGMLEEQLRTFHGLKISREGKSYMSRSGVWDGSSTSDERAIFLRTAGLTYTLLFPILIIAVVVLKLLAETANVRPVVVVDCAIGAAIVGYSLLYLLWTTKGR